MSSSCRTINFKFSECPVNPLEIKSYSNGEFCHVARLRWAAQLFLCSSSRNTKLLQSDMPCRVNMKLYKRDDSPCRTTPIKLTLLPQLPLLERRNVTRNDLLFISTSRESDAISKEMQIHSDLSNTACSFIFIWNVQQRLKKKKNTYRPIFLQHNKNRVLSNQLQHPSNMG